MRILGLDVGSKTVGVAVSDPLGITAQGVTTLRRKSAKGDVADVKRLAAEYEASRVVVGLPLNMDGSEGPRAAASRAFGDAVSEATGLPVEYQDERLSTVAAERVLLEGDVSRKKRREVIDRLAAQIILQAWLDARRPGHTHEPEIP
jgi:putative Holliday junction resolvase